MTHLPSIEFEYDTSRGVTNLNVNFERERGKEFVLKGANLISAHKLNCIGELIERPDNVKELGRYITRFNQTGSFHYTSNLRLSPA